jgi:hypothetical protein
VNQRRNLIILAAVLLVLTSVCRLPLVGQVRLSFQLLFQISVAIMLAYGIWIKGNRWLSGLLLLATFSCFHPKLTTSSYVTFQVIVFGAVWYLFLVYGLKRKYVNILLDAMCIIAICNVLYQIGQGFGYDFIYKAKGDVGDIVRTPGLMSNRNELSAVLAFCLPAFFRRGWAWLIPLMIVGFINTKVFGGVLAGLVVTIVYLFKYERKWIGIAGVIAAVTGGVLFFTLVGGSDSSRLTAWTLAWDLYRHNWVFGFGLGNWQEIFRSDAVMVYFTATFAQAHNDLVQGVFEMGIGFAVLTTGYFVSIIRRANKKAILSLAAITGIVVNSLVNFPFHVAITAMIAITWMAILEHDLREYS